MPAPAPTTKTRRNGSTTPCVVRRGRPPAAARLNSRLERGAQVVGQRLQRRPGAGAGDPGEDRVRAGEHVQVRRLPGVDRRSRAAGQRVEVDRPGRGCRARRRRRCARRTAPRRRARRGSCGWARRSCRAPGRRTSRRARPRRPARQQVEVAGHPLQGRVGDQHVDRSLGRPPSRAGRRPRTRSGDRSPRAFAIISGLESRPMTSASGPAVGEQRGEVAGAAAEVDDGRAGRRRRSGRAARRTDGRARRRR